MMNTDFRKRVDEALHDDFLRGAIKNATELLRTRRVSQWETLEDAQEWRARAQAIRTHTVLNLDKYLDQFTTKLEENGAKVHWAMTDQEAVRHIQAICSEKNAKMVVKSKSMVSEEIHLNHHLEKDGIEVVETDLGEYIIQLAKETPSHIIVPSIHHTRGSVSKLFSKVAKEELPAETPALTAFARKVLRQKFIDADIGITGCNFAIAETGSIVLFTNEGNGRMVNSMPDTQIVIMGMERILPSFKDLDPMLALLPRSATGQKITSYVSILNGPRRTNEADGAKNIHVVIVDNGRSRILGSKYQEVLNCIRCGSCLNVCPVYRQIGGHAYGWVYPGPIGSVITPLLDGLERWGELPYASSLCGACWEACPVRIPLHELLLELRNDKTKLGKNTKEKLAFKMWSKAFSSPGQYRMMLKVGRKAQIPFVKDGKIRGGVPAPVSEWTKTRDLPPIAKQPFHERWNELKRGDI
ncbi:LutB/LldF family L-lactate oxidation iron-sulfur protein [Desulfuribacillus alkaliarsenatis]|uniref:Iron-sulfur cluster-binding protein n=1 Tax=Desulfuribacillus alkaliarsenatis TaxID=766136 RepID=A0A1E5G508_9FIRM|nr:LutB/LldF family L-lactate oxidation iron-sulfur protein [Desulfuribacillus alkaliarsenatis]OEF98185.1 iron-sulfur cluster-binding protein [Desulfuribacillus alkaliarsenatis]